MRVFLACLALFCSSLSADSNSVLGSLPELMRQARVPGMVIVMVEDGSITQQRAYGVRSLASGEPLVVDDVFEAASNGKVIAAYRLLSLVGEGILALDSPVSDSRIASACGSPALSAILSHTAGMSNNILADVFAVDCSTRGEFSYAGEGYVALEGLFHGESAADISRHVFAPLGMMSSEMGESRLPVVAGHPDILYTLATGTFARHASWTVWLVLALSVSAVIVLCIWVWRRLPWSAAVPAMVSSVLLAGILLVVAAAQVQVTIPSRNRGNDIASTLKTTGPDLARFAIELMSPTLVSRATRDLMFEPVARVNERVSWGRGVGIDNSRGVTTYWHWGSNPGYQSLFVVEPASNRGIVILTNGGGFSDYFFEGRGGYALARMVARELLGIDGHWAIESPGR